MWNVLTVPVWSTATTNPSWTIGNNFGSSLPGTSITFSITGTISSYNGSQSPGGLSNSLGADYFLWFAGSTPGSPTNPIQFQFFRFDAGRALSLTLLGSSQYNNRDFMARVDTNGNGDLTDETAADVPSEDYGYLLSTTIGNGLIISIRRTIFLPMRPSRTLQPRSGNNYWRWIPGKL